MQDFCHIHLHSHGSPLDGVSVVEEIVDTAIGHGQTSVSLTDHGTLSQSYYFYKAGKEKGIKTIQGMEAYITPDLEQKDKETEIWHMILLAQNRAGLEDLFALSKIGWTQGFYRKPRISYKELEKYGRNLIATTACQGGEVARAIEEMDTDKAIAALRRYRDIFGDRLYIELQPGNPVALNSELCDLSYSLGIRTVVGVDAHHANREQEVAQELMLLMQQIPSMKASEKDFAKLNFAAAKNQSTIMNRINTLWPDRKLRFDHLDLHIMSRDEVVAAMNAQGFNGVELADTTLEISERCGQVEFKTRQNYLPKVLKSVDSFEYLKALTYEGLEEMGKHKDEVYVARVEEELAAFKLKGFEDYFLIVWDIVREARERDIYMSPGRGSAAGSLVAYCLKITRLDPIKYNLLFARFIDIERDDFPDWVCFLPMSI